jgi:thioredoxin reductase (NADPH)
MDTPHHPLIIVGGGPAGYTAGIYAARALLAPVLFEGPQPGGQLTITTEVENWPGHHSVQGPELMAQMRGHALAAGTTIREGKVDKVTVDGNGLFHLVMEDGSACTADSVIAATGAVARWLGIPGEEALRGYGVSACATCDGFFFRGQDVIVVGGGNTALEEALFLTRFARQVTIVHRRGAFRGEKILQERVLAHPRIQVAWNQTPVAIRAADGALAAVAGLETRTDDGTPVFHAASGVFVAIGHAPASQPFAQLARLNADGTIWTEPGTTRTSQPGLFAAGDVADSRWRQAITSAGMGCMAALDAERWLSHTPH